MKIQEITRGAMIEALLEVRRWCDDETEREWDEIASLVNDAIELYQHDARRAESAAPFDGSNYNPAVDDARLTRQLGRVFEVLADGHPHTLPQISEATGGDPVASVSAQIRHLRKAKHGAWIVDKWRDDKGSGLWWYQMRNPDGSRLPPVRPDALSE